MKIFNVVAMYMKKYFSITVFLISIFAAQAGLSAQTTGYIDEIQVINDFENGNPYRYALVYLTPSGGSQTAYVLILPNNEQFSLLVAAQASNRQVYISSSSTWGMSPSAILNLSTSWQKIDRVIVYTE